MGLVIRCAAHLIGVLLIRARGLYRPAWRLIAGPWRGGLPGARRGGAGARGGGPGVSALLGALRNIPLL
ncbi:MAG TPA: hypothetical protein VM536_10845 [Chloroflexia bacterium]|nr:hypothetical protein [Chloroflexia bacterium]